MRCWRFLLLLAAALGTSGAALGTTVRRMALQELVRAADRIVVGTVARVEEGRDPAGAPCTFVTLWVSQTLKGSAPRELTIKQFGSAGPGAAGAKIPGLPRYREGEEVVLFLHRESHAGFTSPVGLYQGKYRIVREGARASVRGPAGHPVLSSVPSARGGAAARAATGTGGTVTVPLADFLFAVAAIAAQP